MNQFLLKTADLERSSVVANSTMNRERNCLGGNSYYKELAFDPIQFIESRAPSQNHIAWLDLCCGTGKALIEAAQLLTAKMTAVQLQITGIDLVGMFYCVPSEIDVLELTEVSVADFRPTSAYDLITCVHGLHYIGDKLETIRKAVSWLKDDGILIANLDLSNLKEEGGENAGGRIMRKLKGYGLEYDRRKHIIKCRGKKQIEKIGEYLGANDQAGPNYTGQAVVDSYYSLARDSA